MAGAGAMNERLVIERSDPAALAIASVTRAGAVATATTSAAHGYATNDYVTIAGAVEAAYNGKVMITVTGALSFTYPVAGAPSTPATGTITTVYVSDAQGGRRLVWRTLDTVAAELLPLRAGESLRSAAIQPVTDLRFRIRTRVDVTAKMRVRWTPTWPPSAAEQALEIHGVLPVHDGRTWLYLECGKVA